MAVKAHLRFAAASDPAGGARTTKTVITSIPIAASMR